MQEGCVQAPRPAGSRCSVWWLGSRSSFICLKVQKRFPSQSGAGATAEHQPFVSFTPAVAYYLKLVRWNILPTALYFPVIDVVAARVWCLVNLFIVRGGFDSSHLEALFKIDTNTIYPSLCCSLSRARSLARSINFISTLLDGRGNIKQITIFTLKSNSL